MSEVHRVISAAPTEVWRVLSDGWLYTGWVVGASHVRAVDPGWPGVGQKLHHSVGVWPLLINDSTSVVEMEPNRRLVLQARAWPAGEARVEIDLIGDGGATTVTINETPSKGPGKWMHNRLQDKVLTPATGRHWTGWPRSPRAARAVRHRADSDNLSASGP